MKKLIDRCEELKCYNENAIECDRIIFKPAYMLVLCRREGDFLNLFSRKTLNISKLQHIQNYISKLRRKGTQSCSWYMSYKVILCVWNWD